MSLSSVAATPYIAIRHLCGYPWRRHPVLLAGMNIAAGPKLAAAVTAAGGLGVFGGVTFTPNILRMKLDELKEELQVR